MLLNFSLNDKIPDRFLAVVRMKCNRKLILITVLSDIIRKSMRILFSNGKFACRVLSTY